MAREMAESAGISLPCDPRLPEDDRQGDRDQDDDHFIDEGAP